MATEKQQLETNDRWKARYYEVLEELEGKQKEWLETAQLLDALASHFTGAADIGISDLPGILSDLQQDIAEGKQAGEIQAHINIISQRLVELHQHNNQANAIHPASVFVDILEKLELPEQLVQDFKSLKKNVKNLAWHDEGSEVSALFMNIIQRLLHDDAELTWTARKQKLISRLLARANQSQDTDKSSSSRKEPAAQTPARDVPQRFIAPAVGELLLQLALRMPDTVKSKINFATLKKHTNKARRRKDLIPIIDVIAQQIESAYQAEQNEPVLLKSDSVDAVASAISPLFELLEPPVDLKPSVAELEAKFFSNKDDVDTLVYCLNGLNEIVTEVGRRFASQRDELEQYLAQEVEQYHELENELQATGAKCEEQATNDKALSEAFEREISELKSSIQSTDNLPDMRTEIIERLELLQQRAGELDNVTTERNITAVTLLDSMKVKLNEMEGASADLRNKLDEFRQQSLEDVLTGISSRYAYEKRLAMEVARCKRYSSTLSLLVWRVEQFTDIVQSYSNAAGDRILQTIATSLHESIRATDFVARYGADEFIILMPETKRDDAMNVAEKLREKIEKVPFVYHDIRVTLSISAGVAQYQNNETANNLFERADKAMRKAGASDIFKIAAAD